MLNSFLPKNHSEEEVKFLQERIHLVEKHLSDLCNVFGQYARKAAKVRDKGDELAKSVQAFSSSENINKSLSMGLETFAESIVTLSDYGDARAQALEIKVVSELSKYGEICKKAKEEAKDIFAAREKEVQRKKQLDRLKDQNPKNRQQIIEAETRLVKATAELSKTIQNIEEKASTFERQKIQDVKTVLLDFISVEMGYHAKALEVLTNTFSVINSINEDSDLEEFQTMQGKLDMEFKKSLRLPVQHQSPVGSALTRSTQSLGALFPSSSKSALSKERLNKSEETLDSLKNCSYSEESETSESEEESEDQAESPTMDRRAK